MWFEVIVDFVVNLFPKIQETALNIMEWITQPIGITALDLVIYPYEIMFGGGLTLIISYGLVSWILDIWPG